MIDPHTHPSRLLKTVAGVARWSLGVLLVFWLLLTIAWGALHFLIVPRIGDFRAQLQAHATRVLGVPVQIGAMVGGPGGLIPSIALHDVALLDSAGQPALLLPKVIVAVSPRSLLRGGFDQLYIERPVLDVRRAADGTVWVAGLDMTRSEGDGQAASDWLFSQTEVYVKEGRVRWTDEQRQAPPLVLDDLTLVLRNRNWQHQLRLDATPPAAFGDRFSVVGLFRAPFLQVRDRGWQDWSGKLYADFSRVDVSQLRYHADVGVDITQGRGALRAWADVQRGQVVGGAADLALADVRTTLAAGLEPLALPTLQGRLGGRRLEGGFEFFTQALQFEADDGLLWPGGNVRMVYTDAAGQTPARGEFRADRLDLAALAQVASRLPLASAAHTALRTYTPKGLVNEVQAHWSGPLEKLQQYQVRAQVQGLALAGETAGVAPLHLGLRGATVDIDMNQAGGKAALQIAAGALVLPGVFEDPVVLLDRLSADVRWQMEGERIAVQANDVQFSNADAQGQARATWHTSTASATTAASRFPGVLDLSGALSRADGRRVHRYLPLAIDKEARHYVRDAVVAGSASSVQFKVKGDLQHLPFNDPKQGEFRIAARIKDATYAFVPPSAQPASARPWPALTKLSGDLIFDRASMQVRDASGLFSGRPGLRVSKVNAKIADLSSAVVEVSADARGPLTEMLALVANSPLGEMTGNALSDATGTGNADLKLALSLPLNALDTSKVQGGVTLAGNSLRITPDTPALDRVRGAVQFTETGFSLANVQAQALGGPLRIDGGMRTLAANAPATESPVQLRAQGTATAEGLQRASQLGPLSRLAQRASGSAPYTLNLAFRRGIPEIQVTTSLQGMALNLPAPFGKTAQSSLPARFESQVARESLVGLATSSTLPALRDQITLDLGAIGSASYVRDLSRPQPRVLRGAIGLGLAPGESAPMPSQGVVANINQNRLDADAWDDLLAQADTALPTARNAPASDTTDVESVGAPLPAAGSSGRSGTSAPSVSPADFAQEYLPTTLALRTRSLTLEGRTLNNVVLGAAREGAVWQVNLDARELNGYLEYRPPGSPGYVNGRVFARLSRLNMPQSDVTQVEALLDEQPGTLPSLDIAVDNFELRGKLLGRVVIEAYNRGGEASMREWRMSRFDIIAPEATLTATGNWTALGGTRNGERALQRRTVLNFALDIRDSGDLLTRMGMPDVIRRGKGRMQGQIAWIGAPFSPDYRTMTGQINVNVASGQFLKADPGLAKLLGVLSLQSLPRRLALDFRDVFSEGFAFDFVRGDVRIDQGVAATNNLQMKGVNAAVLMEGSADIDKETQSLRVVVVPEINALTASLVATAINPVIGLGTFLAQVFLRGPLIEAATQEFHIDGTWSDPRIQRVPRSARTDRDTTARGDAAAALPSANGVTP